VCCSGPHVFGRMVAVALASLQSWQVTLAQCLCSAVIRGSTSGTRPCTGSHCQWLQHVVYCGAQIEEAVDVFESMVARGCERNVITYSSLITACEKAGRWELALQLFEDMQREGCKPNVVTYNSLITACGNGMPSSSPHSNCIFSKFAVMGSKGCLNMFALLAWYLVYRLWKPLVYF
jgi:pentatricopeptide repeat protein